MSSSVNCDCDDQNDGEPIIPPAPSQLQEIDGNMVSTNDTENLLAFASTESSSSNGSTWYASVFLVVNAALGAGLLDFPQAFSQAGGVWVAIIVQIVLLVFVVIALIILTYCSKTHSSKTYQEVVASVCGKGAWKVCTVVIALYCYGTCITFIIIIGDQLDRVFASMYGSNFCHLWYMNRYVTTPFICIFILTLSFSKKIDFLQWSSYLGVLAVMYVEFVIIYKYYEGSYTPGPIKTSPSTWTDAFLVVPVICFGYQCHVSCIPVYACLKDKRVKNFLKTIVVAIMICAFTYSVAATYGYLTFGSDVQSDILYMYDAKDPIVLVGIIALAAKTFTTYPILQFCGRAAIDDLYVQLKHLSVPQAKLTERKRHTIITVIWFFSSLVLALLIPNIGDVIEYLGSLAVIFIFVFPGLCLLRETLKTDRYLINKSSKFSAGLSIVFVAVGFFIFGLTITQSIQDDVKQNSGTDIKLCT